MACIQRALTAVLCLTVAVEVQRSSGVWGKLRGGHWRIDTADAALLSSVVCAEAAAMGDVQLKSPGMRTLGHEQVLQAVHVLEQDRNLVGLVPLLAHTC